MIVGNIVKGIVIVGNVIRGIVNVGNIVRGIVIVENVIWERENMIWGIMVWGNVMHRVEVEKPE